MSTKIRKNAGKLLYLHQNLTKVESRHDSTNHASILVFAAPRIRIVYEVVMIQQVEITLKSKSRGFHLVTSDIMSQLPQLPKTGIMNIFCKHTSCGLSINENADPDVRVDMETIFNRLVPENRPEYEHTLEGADDMPAHAKSTLSGVSLTIPITDGRLNMGTWQGIYFCEYRNFGGARKLVVTIIGE